MIINELELYSQSKYSEWMLRWDQLKPKRNSPKKKKSRQETDDEDAQIFMNLHKAFGGDTEPVIYLIEDGEDVEEFAKGAASFNTVQPRLFARVSDDDPSITSFSSSLTATCSFPWKQLLSSELF
ncbi:hypothetical protein OS493_006929 [Desmophyllum pertusum]|uniref:Uncharacterized protein n=1 Tax=Desmophyllum pertusum TaxID=174260 RepID=A0A9X0D4T6_9CNID|nr:hypothetical protein OS493_006929 [Desmophyllum pertusum]